MVKAMFDVDAIVKEAVDKEMTKQHRLLRAMQEQAWSQGYQACREGKQEFRNPFRPESADDAVLDRANLG